MRTVITVKLIADSKAELMNTFPSQVRAFREQFDAIVADGFFGPADKTEARYLIVGGEWFGDSAENQVPDLS